MNLKLKICGLRDEVNIQAISSLGPDFQGFIYYPKSIRFVGNDFRIPVTATAKRVGVFVNEAVSVMLDKVKEDGLDMVQLHGDEMPRVAEQLKDKGVSVMKAFSVDEQFDFNRVEPFVPFVQYFMFDTKTQVYGGSGQTFDWALLNQYSLATPFFLSGGLSPENISEIIHIKNPAFYGVDVNSRVEDAPGIKNINRVKELIRILKTI